MPSPVLPTTALRRRMPKPSVEMLPALLMPPAKVVVFLTAMAVAFALMLLPLSP